MFKQWWKLGLAAVLAAVLGLASLNSVAFAQAGQPAGGGGAGRGGRWGGPQSSLVATAAQVLNMERVDLIAELTGGQTLAQVAQAHGSSADALVEAWQGARQQSLNEAVAAGRLTQAQAEVMLANMRASAEAQVNSPWTSQGQGTGQGYVDADGDGVCDWGTAQPRQAHGRGQR